MSNEASVAYAIITSYLPQIILLIVMPTLAIGLATRFMRNPH